MLAILERVARREPASGRLTLVLGALALSLVIPCGARSGPRGRQGRAAVRHGSRSGHDQVGVAVAHALPKALSASPSDEGVVRCCRRHSDHAGRHNRGRRGAGRALEDSVASVREDAAYALGQLQAGGAVEPLVTWLGREPASKVREMIAWALGQIESRSASVALAATAQRDTSGDVRAMAVWALAQIQDPEAVPALTALLGDRSAEVRGRAAWAIGTIGP